MWAWLFGRAKRQSCLSAQSVPPPLEAARAEEQSTTAALERKLAWMEEREASRRVQRDQLMGLVEDSLGQARLGAEIAGGNQELQALLDRLLDRLNQMQRELRAEASPLGTVADGVSLSVGLHSLLEQARMATDMTVEVRVDPSVDGTLTNTQTYHTLHLVREAVTNIIRHSRGSRMSVRVGMEGRRCVVSVADDGCGFDVSRPPGSGQGIRRMYSRAEAGRGLLQIESAQGVGTIVTLTFPSAC